MKPTTKELLKKIEALEAEVKALKDRPVGNHYHFHPAPAPIPVWPNTWEPHPWRTFPTWFSDNTGGVLKYTLRAE